jgi:intracellular septation protein
MRNSFTSDYEQAVLFLADFFPLILFLAAYLYKDIYFAVVTLMVAMPIGLAVKYLKVGKVDRIYLWSTVFLLLFGGATLYLHNPVFLYWKPTAFYWVLALAFLISHWVGEKPLVEKFFSLIGDLKTDQISTSQWRTLNLVWVIFLVAIGFLNIFVAYKFSELAWVRFKVLGLTGLTLVFMTAQSFWIFSKIERNKPDIDDGEI